MPRQLPLSNCSTFTLVDDADFLFLSQWKWRINSKGYVTRTETLDGKRVYFNLHRVIMDAPRGLCVDHINGDKLLNTRANLRLATPSQNLANRGLFKSSTSGFKGVTKRGSRWHARIWVQGAQIHLGFHDKAYVASLIYDSAARRFFGEFARLNHPDMPRMLFYEELLDCALSQHQPVKPPIRKPKAPYVPRSKSSHKGVYWSRGRWRATIYRNGHREHLGYFTTEEAAAQAYQAARDYPSGSTVSSATGVQIDLSSHV